MKKYKIKTKSSAKKRFKKTGSGKLLRYQAGKRHLLEHKKKNRKKSLSGACEVSSADNEKVKGMLPGF